MESFYVVLLVFSAIALLQPISATFPNENSLNSDLPPLNADDQESVRNFLNEAKPVFPKHLDISSLQNMPLIILHPRSPIKLQMLPGASLASIHDSLTPGKIMELLQSVALPSPPKMPPQNSKKEENEENRPKYSDNRQPQATVNRAVSTEFNSRFNDPALPRSLLNANNNNGWFQKFRGSFSNMFPRFRPGHGGPFPLSLPTMNMPSFLPQPSNTHGMVSPFAPNPIQQFQSLPWRKFYSPSIGHDLNTGASNLNPLRAMFSNLPMIGYRPTGYGHPAFGGDLAASGSAFIPRHIIPPPHFTLPRPPVQRHKPLFNDFGSLQAASMEISNAFADFTDSKEHGPEVTQKFGSVGHSINNFLKMMGLGPDQHMGHVGGFGGGADLAALDSTPIARSLDFYPGYGNQEHLDDFENLDDIQDFPEFEEDITQEFMKKMNITNETMMSDAKKLKDILDKEFPVSKTKAELMSKVKMPVNMENKDKDHEDKPKKNVGNVSVYAAAVPLEKLKDEKVPTVNYKIPPIHSTVAPHDRKQPIAIYQNFNSKDNNAHKSPAYAPAQAMPHQKEEEDNPNKLVDADVVRQWRLVNSGKGYVEKHPVPILDVVRDEKQPESLKLLQKLISETAKDGSS